MKKTEEKKLLRRAAAFTLIEMMIVTGMLGVLMGVAFTGIGHARRQAKITKAHAEIRELMNAWMSYEAAYDDWPLEMQGDDIEATEENLKELLDGNQDQSVYLNVNIDRGAFRDPWGTPYRFKLVYEDNQNRKTEDFDASVTFPNRHRHL